MLSLLASRFWLRGTSTRAVAQELNGVFGTKLSAGDVSRFSQELLPQLEGWLQRPIEQPIAYLYLDALYLPVRKPGFTTKQALLCAIGIATDGTKHVLAFMLGDRENLDSWTNLLDELLKRGLDRSALRLVISDEHKAIVNAVEQRLGVAHQLCLIHKMRNALVRVAAKQRKAFYADFKAAFWAKDKDDAMRALGRLEARWAKSYPKATAIAISNPAAFLRFMDQPQKLWTILRSSNFIERFNRELRRRLRCAGTMHCEDELWKLVASVSIEQEKRWLKRKAYAVKELKAAA
jgi:transposase-like protein